MNGSAGNRRTNLKHGLTAIGKTTVPPLGFGAAPIGNLYTAVSEDEAVATVNEALSNGISYFDTAPYYGCGLSESRLGRGLSGRPRGSYAISTKVGRCVEEDASISSGCNGFAVSGRHAVFDYSRDGVLRSFESSLKRLGTDYIDILLLHDIGRLTHGASHQMHMRQALDEALPAMAEMKASGACGAIGIGVNEEAVCLELMPLFELDCIMLAGRYTLLEQTHSVRVMDEASRRSVAILAAGPYNSGLLASANGPGSTYDYGAVDAETQARAQHIYDVCAMHDVDVGAAALQFPLAHPAVATVVAGMRSVDEVRRATERAGTSLAPNLWRHLRERGLLLAQAVVPS